MTHADAPSGLDLVVRPGLAEAALWRRLRFEAEDGCREELFGLYAGLARALARRHYRRRASRRIDQGDFEQFAFAGLLQAIDRYDPLLGVPFGAYARRRIAGSIADGVSRMTEVDAQLSHRHRIEQERLRSLARRPAEGEGGDPLTEVTELVLGLAYGLILERTSLAAAADGADTRAGAYESLAWRELQSRLGAAVAALPEREAKVVRNHYELGLSFAQIADLLGLSRGRVSQLHRAALERLRKRMGGFK
ncbi:MAG: polymerase sigma factor FliA [Sphingomonadales bacterium]|nr:polymerase sigma factor FliA [Sphingomonadales bacterium]